MADDHHEERRARRAASRTDMCVTECDGLSLAVPHAQGARRFPPPVAPPVLCLVHGSVLISALSSFDLPVPPPRAPAITRR